MTARIQHSTLHVGSTDGNVDVQTEAVYCADPKSTGSHECDAPINGQYIYIRKGGSGFNLLELRPFGGVNLTKDAEIYSAITSDPSAPINVDP